MNLQRAVSVTLAVAAAAMLATSSLGYTSVSAERGVQIEVVDTENAYVNAIACSTNNGNGNGNGNGNPVKVHVTNQYSDEFTVEQITSDTDDEIAAGHVPESLSPGESHVFQSLQANDEVTITVTGGLDAAVTVDVKDKQDCPFGPGSSNGNGQNANGQGNPQDTTNDETTTTESESTTTVQNETTESA